MMSETHNGEESRSPGTSGLAVTSISLAVLGLGVLAWRLLAYRPWWSEYVSRNIIGLLGIVGLILGYVTLARISKRIASIALLVLSSPLLLVWCSFFLIGESGLKRDTLRSSFIRSVRNSVRCVPIISVNVLAFVDKTIFQFGSKAISFSLG